MTTRYVQSGTTMDFVNNATPRAVGAVVLIGTRIGVCLDAIPANATGVVQTLGVFEITKLTADVVTQGALLYWDNAAGRLTLTSAGNTLAGFAMNNANGTATTVLCSINA